MPGIFRRVARPEGPVGILAHPHDELQSVLLHLLDEAIKVAPVVLALAGALNILPGD